MEERKFRPDVEGLRAIAVGLVVLGHAGVPWLEGGYIGVDVFFVLSGFLITGQLFRDVRTTGKSSLAGFYARRARRILPAACLVLVITVLASYRWLGFLRGDVIAEDGMWTAAFMANVHFAAEGTQYLNVTAPPSPLQHYWSLAVEEQFYLAWPLLFLVVAWIGRRWLGLERSLIAVLVVIVAASLAWSVLETTSDPVWAFFSPFTRAWELAVGALLAVAASQLRFVPRRAGTWISWAGLAAIFAGAFAFDNTTAFPGYSAALPVFGTAMVVAAGTLSPGCGAERVLRLKPFQLIGLVSYALYLWHWPLLIIPTQHAGETLPAANIAALMVVALGLAMVTHYVVENPVRYARPLVYRPAASLAVGGTLVVAVFTLCAWQLRDAEPSRVPVAGGIISFEMDFAALPPATPQDGVTPAPRKTPVEDVVELVAASPAIEALPADAPVGLADAQLDLAWLVPMPEECLVDPEVVRSPDCIFGDPDGSRTVVILGDSHAAQWLGPFDAIGRSAGWQVHLFGKAGCPVVSLEFKNAIGSGADKLIAPAPPCGPWLEDSVARINAMQPDLLVLGSCNGCDYMVDGNGNPLTKEAWAEGLQTTLSKLQVAPEQVVVMGDIPRWRGALDCLSRHQDQVQGCAVAAADAIGATFNDVESAVALERGMNYLDVTSWFCTTVCSPVIGNMIVYNNDYHVTATYANHLASALAWELLPLMTVARPVPD